MGRVKGSKEGAGREKRVFFSPLPPPFPSFALAPTVRATSKGYYFYSPIFHCHKIKDGGYNNITNTNKVSPTQNMPALQAIWTHIMCAVCKQTPLGKKMMNFASCMLTNQRCLYHQGFICPMCMQAWTNQEELLQHWQSTHDQLTLQVCYSTLF